MGFVRISTLVSKDYRSVFDILKETEHLHEIMPQIKRAAVLLRLSPHRQISEWEVAIEGATIRWKEEDTYDDEHCTFSFRVVEGDYHAEGRWRVEQVGVSEARVILEAEFDWGLINLGKYVGPVLEKKAKKNLRRMVAALRKTTRNGQANNHG